MPAGTRPRSAGLPGVPCRLRGSCPPARDGRWLMLVTEALTRFLPPNARGPLPQPSWLHIFFDIPCQRLFMAVFCHTRLICCMNGTDVNG